MYFFWSTKMQIKPSNIVNVTTCILLYIKDNIKPFPASFSPNTWAPSDPVAEKEPDSAVCQWLKEELASLTCHHKWAKPSGSPERPSKAHFQLYHQMTHFLIGLPIIVMGIGCMQLNLSYIFVGRRVEELTEPRGWYERIIYIYIYKKDDRSLSICLICFILLNTVEV